MGDTLIKFDGKNCSTVSCGYNGEHAAGVVAHINKMFAQEIHDISKNISSGLNQAFTGDFGSQAVAAAGNMKSHVIGRK